MGVLQSKLAEKVNNHNAYRGNVGVVVGPHLQGFIVQLVEILTLLVKFGLIWKHFVNVDPNVSQSLVV